MDIENGVITRQCDSNGVLVVFNDVCCKVPVRNFGLSWLRRKQNDEKLKSREILKGVCGALRPGRVTFILGPSGAGKTTLLNILAGRRKIGVSGSISRGNHEVVLVPQHAALIDSLTVKETLMFAAALKMPTLSQREREYAIERVTNQLGIQGVLDTRTGQLSGGETKRLTISCELLTDPFVMLLDEPTSGLDSVSSLSVIKALRDVANSGRTVACVIHQPSSKIYSSADDALVLANGKTLYAGTVTGAPGALLKSGFDCPHYYNVADYLLEVAAGEHQGNLSLLENDAKMYTSQISSLTEEKSLDNNKTSQPMETVALLNGLNTDPLPGYRCSSWQQLNVLLWRCCKVATRDIHLSQIRVACHLVVAILLGAVYNGAGSDAARVTTNTACIFFFLLFLFFSNSMPTIYSFPVEANVVLQQHLNKWYSLHTYCASKIIAELPLQIVCATMFVIPAWWMTSQAWECYRLLFAWLICILMTILAQTFGLIVGAACGVQLGLFVVPAANIPMLMFSDFFIPFKEMSVYLQPIATISYFRYSFDALMKIAYGFNREKIHCSVPFCLYRTPQKYLNDIGLNIDFRLDIGVLLIWIIILQSSLCVVLRIKVWFACR